MTISDLQRRRGLRLAMIAGIPVAGIITAVTAFACTSSATISFDRQSGTAGTIVNGSGGGFSGSPASSSINIYFDSTSSQPLWTGHTAGVNSGAISFRFTTPDVSPGYHVVIATQYDSSGNAIAGTPARASYQVMAASNPNPQPNPQPGNNNPPPPANQPQPHGQPATVPAQAGTAPQAPAAIAPAPAVAPQAPAGAGAAQPAPVQQGQAVPARPAPQGQGSQPALSPSTGSSTVLLALALAAGAMLLSLVPIGYVVARRRRQEAPAHRQR